MKNLIPELSFNKIEKGDSASINLLNDDDLYLHIKNNLVLKEIQEIMDI